MTRLLAAVLLTSIALFAQTRPVYYLLWFDTEDYIDPASDDAALRLATTLEKMGLRATFKVVGEKARGLEKRNRLDVIKALSRHDIGYHTNYHSIPPAPAAYQRILHPLEAVEEFSRREEPGLRDVQRIFGILPSCYGQPGDSWGPAANVALRRWGVPVYMDDGGQVGLNGQPFWLGGMLYVFNLKGYTLRPDINHPETLQATNKKFDDMVASLRAKGGGVIQTYFHPTEFSSTEFWDAVNFLGGNYTPPGDYKMPRRRSPEPAENAYKTLFEFVRHIQSIPDVQIVTARELPLLFENPVQRPSASDARRQFQSSIDMQGPYSAADQLLALLGMEPQYVDGPVARGQTVVLGETLSRILFDRAKLDAVGYIETHRRLPHTVWAGSQRLSLPDFAATLAGDDGGPVVQIRKGVTAFERYVAADTDKNYGWVIHPKGFAAPELLEQARLQAWTLKPARLR
ncbi:MAG: hypothetical protein HYX27_03965 [Acidobacteria bacterium]|nr:hypothetical protein [Acidobacteriota bacterium]